MFDGKDVNGRLVIKSDDTDDVLVLAHTNCSCIQNITIRENSVNNVCIAEYCKKDDTVLCGNRTKSNNDYVIYEKVNFDEELPSGNCLSVNIQQNGSVHFQTRDCQTKLFQICKHDQYFGFFSEELRQKHRWRSSHEQCKAVGYLLASFNTIKKSSSKVGRKGCFWLAKIRTPIIQNTPAPNPKFCIAVQVSPNNNKVTSSVRSCNQALRALCKSLPGEFDGTEDDKSTKSILIIAVVITASCAVVVVIVITVLIITIRKNSSRPGISSRIVSSNQVVYAMVNKPTTTSNKQELTGNQTAGKTENDDTYDHMEHHRSSQNQNNECNYDTMQSVRTEEIENDYDVTNRKERDGQFMIDESAEYSHLEVENEVKKDKSSS
ncbi:unnamed protein product [Mytilus coruscus]|uniref:Uncharacterized protein n=1 Tax=Mytilus coruscus TaxID=42192 RepID=A0A6J8EHM4_MYTCO|nr:unnamed protein product [Mytilus coruscus]